MCVIIRRPHAYFFLNQTFASEGGIASSTVAGSRTEDGKKLPLPGLYVLDAEGKFVASAAIRNVDDVVKLLKDSD